MGVSIAHQRGVIEALKDKDLSTVVLRAMLMKSTHVPGHDDSFVSDISADEATGGTYARVTLSGVTVAQDDANDRVTLDFNDPTFSSPASAQDIIGMEVYMQVGADDSTPADDALVAFIGFGGATVAGLTRATRTITLSVTAATAGIAAGDRIQLHGNANGNDGTYTVASVSGSDVVVNEAIGGAADGGGGTVYELFAATGNNIDVTMATPVMTFDMTPAT
ncbi:MAG: hypothetical protein KatS3mg051_1713 [Anaerolineae bacterium]|nr:MAG: hypothetical protein KatS3mg051_1713 [Anaerolineae bacterium]